MYVASLNPRRWTHRRLLSDWTSQRFWRRLYQDHSCSVTMWKIFHFEWKQDLDQVTEEPGSLSYSPHGGSVLQFIWKLSCQQWWPGWDLHSVCQDAHERSQHWGGTGQDLGLRRGEELWRSDTVSSFTCHDFIFFPSPAKSVPVLLFSLQWPTRKENGHQGVQHSRGLFWQCPCASRVPAGGGRRRIQDCHEHPEQRALWHGCCPVRDHEGCHQPSCE